MGSSIFTLNPSFTQGLIIGQLSILILLALILKYLFLDSQSALPCTTSTSTNPSRDKERKNLHPKIAVKHANIDREGEGLESAMWLNVVLCQVVQTYRSKLRDDDPSPNGDEISRQRIEAFANKMRPQGFVDPIKILSVDLGSSAPRLSNANRCPMSESGTSDEIEFDMMYTDTITVSLSTSVLFNYPMPCFARLPISLTISLALFSSTVRITPPNPFSTNPTLGITIVPNFVLELKTTSLMGSRAKLADVPKLHEMIQCQVRRVVAQRSTWQVVMPWIADANEVKESVAD